MTASPAQPQGQDLCTVVDPRPSRRFRLPLTLRQRALANLWRLVRTLLFVSTPASWSRWRVFLLNWFGADVHPTVRVHESVKIDFPWNLRVGAGSIIEHAVILACAAPVHIDQNVRVSQYAHLFTTTLDYRRRELPIVLLPVHVQSDVWLGADCLLGPGVTVGQAAIVGARAVVMRDVPPGMIAVGNRGQSYLPRRRTVVGGPPRPEQKPG